MTTDTVAKEAAVEVVVDGRTYTVGGMAKGSGMIAPNMATMLAVITTDAPLTSAACDAALRSAVGTTFNRVTVDTDTSTNDMAVLMASGAAGGARDRRREPLVRARSRGRARGLRDARAHDRARRRGRHQAHHGERARRRERSGRRARRLRRRRARRWSRPRSSGATRTGAAWPWRSASRVARSIPTRFDITFAGIVGLPSRRGCRASTRTSRSRRSATPRSPSTWTCTSATASATVWTCDLTYDYVRINGEYRS